MKHNASCCRSVVLVDRSINHTATHLGLRHECCATSSTSLKSQSRERRGTGHQRHQELSERGTLAFEKNMKAGIARLGAFLSFLARCFLGLPLLVSFAGFSFRSFGGLVAALGFLAGVPPLPSSSGGGRFFGFDLSLSCVRRANGNT